MHQHRYPTACPKCDAVLTAPEAVTVYFSIGGGLYDWISQLNKDGLLQDIDRLIENGYHSDTECTACGESLSGYEVL